VKVDLFGRDLDRDLCQGPGYAKKISRLALLSGRGRARDKAKAAWLFRQAAEQGHPDAQCKLGCVSVIIPFSEWLGDWR
jgi:hypothetical protein